MHRGSHPQATALVVTFLVWALTGLPLREAVSGQAIGKITGDGVTTRTGPGVEYERVGRLHAGDQAAVVEVRDRWVKIVDPKGREVWVFASWVEIVPQEPEVGERHSLQPEQAPSELEPAPVVTVQETSATNPPPLLAEEGGHVPWIWIGAGATAAGLIGYFILSGNEEEPNTGSLHVRVEFP